MFVCQQGYKMNSIYTATTPHGIQNLQFNPDQFPQATLKVFNKLIEQYDFSYKAQYPESLKHTIEACITKWTATTKNLHIQILNSQKTCGSRKTK